MNLIERLKYKQTKYIFVNDVIETVNYFKCFDLILDNINKPLTEDFIK